MIFLKLTSICVLLKGFVQQRSFIPTMLNVLQMHSNHIVIFSDNVT